MGNCPSGFVPSPKNGLMCVRDCPRTQGFDLSLANGMAACVYRNRPEVFFPLREVMSVNSNKPVTVDELREDHKTIYLQASEEYDKAKPLALAKVERDQQIADAFAELQAAENVRDQSPQAYQDARLRYYTLLKGDSWVQEEAARIETAEAQPKVNEILASYGDLNNRIEQQQKTIDVVTGVKDKIVSLKDDFKVTTNVFAKQIAELKNQIEIEKRTKVEEKQDIMGWIGFLLNVVLVVILVALAITFGRKLTTKAPAYTSSSVSS